MAGELRQEWTWRDIFRSIGLAFSFSRLMTGLIGLLLFAVVDSLLVWGVGKIGSTGAFMTWLTGEAFMYLRYAEATVAFLFTATAIAYSAKGELLEGEGAGVGESIGFALKKLGAIIVTPLLFWIYIAFMGGFAFVLFVLPAALGTWTGWWVPMVSLVWYALSYVMIFLFTVLAMMGFLAYLFSFFLSPAIIAVRQEGALDAVLDTIDLMRGKGAFWVSIVVLVISSLIGTVFMTKTFHVGYAVAERAMGSEYALTVSQMPEVLQPRRGTMVAGALVGLDMRSYWPSPEAASGTIETRHKISGWILGIWIMLLAGFAVSFMIGAFVAAGTLTYLIVREEEEFLEPVVEGPPKAAGEPAKAADAEKKADEKKPEEKSEGK